MSTDNANTASNPNPGAGDTTTTTETPQVPGSSAPAGTDGGGSGGNAAGNDGKPNEGEGGGEAGKPGDGKTSAAPEQYGQFNLPEGFTLEGDRLGAATQFFKAKGWTQEQAQEAVDLYTQMAGQDAAAMQQAVEAQRLQQIEQWGTETKQQLGAKYDETVGLATTAVKAINDPELTKAFNEQGWGNHPAMVNAFAFMGRFLRDSKIDGLGGTTASGPSASSDPKSILYGG
ncbi:hypothetical protein [Stenotrophomonas beteli]|uniref:Peptidase n=1 Tax=Stenotrophomonas beteli TaxID=3384461 RepID=A0A0R0B607_9GAMM|nr:hypothetical protein [Stenotrophomonas maltophilia]KRG52703.1 hypothetical protein ARC23_04180 [Stenotrophomonas maltophilia]